MHIWLPFILGFTKQPVTLNTDKKEFHSWFMTNLHIDPGNKAGDSVTIFTITIHHSGTCLAGTKKR